VRGRVRARDFIDSPLSGERCVYYRFTVEEYRRPTVAAFGVQGIWALIQEDEAIAEFLIAGDDGSEAIVSPEGVIVARTTPEEIDLSPERRAREARIGEGTLVEVAGVVSLVQDTMDAGRGYRDSAVRFLLRAPDGGRLAIRVIAS
jgi:hypothetical protein